LISPGVFVPGIGAAHVGAAADGAVASEVVSAFLAALADAAEPPVSADIVFAFDVAVVLAALADAAEPPVSADIVFVFDVSTPAAVFAAGVDSPGRPRFFAFPNIDSCSSFSSCCEVAGKESVHGPSGVRANDGLCSTLSSPGLHHNKNMEQCYSKPNPDHNNGSDTNDRPMDATTNHSRKKCLRLCREQRTRRTHRAPLSPLEVLRKRPVAEEEIQYLCLPLPLQELERQVPVPKGLTPRVTFSFCCLLKISDLHNYCHAVKYTTHKLHRKHSPGSFRVH